MDDYRTVYVVDDDPAVLLSVNTLLAQRGYEVRGYLSAAEFLADAAVDRPGCVVTDVQMPDVSGIELQRRLLAADSPLSVVVVTGVADVPMAVALMEHGAVTLLEKPYDHRQLLHAVEHGLAASHRRWQVCHQAEAIRQHLAALTDQERRVMELMVAGKPNKAIARGLNLGLRTVDRRRKAVLKKMGVQTVPELALYLGTSRDADAELHGVANPQRR